MRMTAVPSVPCSENVSASMNHKLEAEIGRVISACCLHLRELDLRDMLAVLPPGVVAVSDRRAQTITTMRPGFKLLGTYVPSLALARGLVKVWLGAFAAL